MFTESTADAESSSESKNGINYLAFDIFANDSTKRWTIFVSDYIYKMLCIYTCYIYFFGYK